MSRTVRRFPPGWQCSRRRPRRTTAPDRTVLAPIVPGIGQSSYTRAGTERPNRFFRNTSNNLILLQFIKLKDALCPAPIGRRPSTPPPQAVTTPKRTDRARYRRKAAHTDLFRRSCPAPHGIQAPQTPFEGRPRLPEKRPRSAAPRYSQIRSKRRPSWVSSSYCVKPDSIDVMGRS